MKTVDGYSRYNLHTPSGSSRKSGLSNLCSAVTCFGMKRLLSLPPGASALTGALIAAVLLVLGCQFRARNEPKASAITPETKPAIASLSTNDLLQHIKVLSSDEFEGRAPGTPGEERTVNYLVSEFKRLGLAPGNPDGSYIQNVPLVGFRARPTIS